MDPRSPEPDPRTGTRDRWGALAGLEALERGVPDRGARDRGTSEPAIAPSPGPDVWAAHAAPAPLGVPVPRHVRSRIRRRGPIVALVLPGVLGLIAVVTLAGSTSTARGVGGFGLALLAAPLLPAFGEPLRAGSGSVLTAAAASAVLWLLIGAFAAQRATRAPSRGWGGYWVEYLWLCLCVWLGAALAVIAANLVLGRVLL